MSAAITPRSTFGDLKIYLPGWVVFGLLSGVFLSGAMPKGWHEIVFDRLPLGLAFGLLSCCVFIALQRLWNSHRTAGKRVLNLILAGTIGDILLVWMISIFAAS